MMMKIQKPVQPVAENNTQDNPFAGKTIVVTGKVEPYTRDEMNSLIALLGAIAGSSVTRKTHYLVCRQQTVQGAGAGYPCAGTAGIFPYGGCGLNTRPVNNNRESAKNRRSPPVFMEELIWIEPISRQS